MSWLRRSLAGLQSPRPGFDHGPVPLRFVTKQMAPAQALPQALHVSPASVTPPVLRVSCSYKKDKRAKSGNLKKGINIRILGRMAPIMPPVVFIKFVLSI